MAPILVKATQQAVTNEVMPGYNTLKNCQTARHRIDNVEEQKVGHRTGQSDNVE